MEQEHKQAEKDRLKIESGQTRKRLNALERAASKFMERHIEESEFTREPDSRNADSSFLQKGYMLNPPFTQIVQGQSARFWFNVNQKSFPEISVGDTVEISCLGNEISVNKRIECLEAHPNQEAVVRCVGLIKGETPTKATGIQVRVGPIVTDNIIEVLESEKEKYESIRELCFNRKRYQIVVGRGKSIVVLAPFPSVVSKESPLTVKCSTKRFRIRGKKFLIPRPDLGIAVCKLSLHTDQPELQATIEARLDSNVATAEIHSVLAGGAPIQIKIVSEDYGNQRYRWDANVLQIAAKHPAVCRYLGSRELPPEQEAKHFRVLLAEIVAEAVCQRVLSKRVADEPSEYQDADWDAYYADYTKLMTEFLPIAHETQVKDP